MCIDNLVQEEISAEFGHLSNMEPGTEEYKVTVDGLTKLMDRAIEMKKFDIENSDKKRQMEIENSDKKRQMEDEQKDRLVKNAISIAGVVIPSLITIWGTVVSLKYDEKGVIPTTIVGRGFISKLLPRK